MRAQGHVLLRQDIKHAETQLEEFLLDQATTTQNKASHERIKKAVGDWIQTTSCDDPKVNDPPGVPPRPSEDERNRLGAQSRKKASGGIGFQRPQDQKKPGPKKKTSQIVPGPSTAEGPVGVGTSKNKFQKPELDLIVYMTDSAATQLQQIRLGSRIELSYLQQSKLVLLKSPFTPSIYSRKSKSLTTVLSQQLARKSTKGALSSTL